MATSKFYKLKPKKRQILLDSVLACLSERDISNISVKSIAEKAEISRGTFYTYFVDLDDSIHTLTVHYINIFFEQLDILLKNNNGSFMKAIRAQYKVLTEIVLTEKYYCLLKNIGDSLNINMVLYYAKSINNSTDETINWFLKETDVGKKIKSRIKAYAFLNMIMYVFISSFLQFALGSDKDSVTKQTFYKFDLLESNYK